MAKEVKAQTLAGRYKELKEKALSNWFTKDIIKADMPPNQFVMMLTSWCRSKKQEMGLCEQFEKLVADWSKTYSGDAKGTVPHFNATLNGNYES